MADDDEPQCKVEYLDEPVEETNWIKRAGRAKVTYVNGHTFEGTFDAERIKQGHGVYVWMAAGPEDDETLVERARFEGNYKDGLKNGQGKMTYPNGDIYEGEWLENKMHGKGSYTFKKTTDVYSGFWLNGKKHGEGRYEFGADSSLLVGTWESGQIVTGAWQLKGAAEYTGQFKLGRPFGQGKFSFTSGLTQTGSYVEAKKAEDEEEPAEGDAPLPPNVTWKGDTIVAF